MRAVERLLNLDIDEEMDLVIDYNAPGYVLIDNVSFRCFSHEDEDYINKEDINKYDCYYTRVEDDADYMMFKLVNARASNNNSFNATLRRVK